MIFTKLNSSTRLFFVAFGLIIAVIISRWQIWQMGMIEFDELIWTNVLRLGYCGVPGVDFEANTTGFISIWILGLMRFMGLEFDYFGLRIWGFIVGYLGSMVMLSFSVKKEERWLIWVLFTGLWMNSQTAFQTYNTEWLGLFFMSLSFWAFTQKENWIGDIIIGLLLVILPIVKMQMILFAGLFWMLRLIEILFGDRVVGLGNRWWIRLLTTVLVPLVLLVYFNSRDWWDAFVFYYWHKNIFYTKLFSEVGIVRAILGVAKSQLFLFFSIWLFFIWFGFVNIRQIMGYFKQQGNHFLEVINGKVGIKIGNEIVVFLALITGIVSIVIPRNNFIHYHQLLLIWFALAIFYCIRFLKSRKMFWFWGVLVCYVGVFNIANGVKAMVSGKGFAFFEIQTSITRNPEVDSAVDYMRNLNLGVQLAGQVNTVPVLFLGNPLAAILQHDLYPKYRQIFRCPNILLWEKMWRYSPELWKKEIKYFEEDIWGNKMGMNGRGPLYIIDTENIVDLGLIPAFSKRVKKDYRILKHFGRIAIYEKKIR